MAEQVHVKCKAARKKLRKKIKEQNEKLEQLSQQLLEHIKSTVHTTFSSSGIMAEFSPEFWTKAPFLWKNGQVVDKDGVEALPCDWNMPSQCDDILREMGGRRVLVEVDERGKDEKQKYYSLQFREGGRIPPSWSMYGSYKFATKVELFMEVDEVQRSDVSKMTSTYKMFGSRRDLLVGRLRLLMSYAYELAKFTWTRTFATDADGDRGISARQLLDKQPPVLRQIAKRAARECQLFNTALYSEEDARWAVGVVFKSFKDTDTFNATLHNLANPLFEQKTRKLFLTAKVPPPFSKKRKAVTNGEGGRTEAPKKKRHTEDEPLVPPTAKAKKKVPPKLKINLATKKSRKAAESHRKTQTTAAPTVPDEKVGKGQVNEEAVGPLTDEQQEDNTRHSKMANVTPATKKKLQRPVPKEKAQLEYKNAIVPKKAVAGKKRSQPSRKNGKSGQVVLLPLRKESDSKPSATKKSSDKEEECEMEKEKVNKKVVQDKDKKSSTTAEEGAVEEKEIAADKGGKDDSDVDIDACLLATEADF